MEVQMETAESENIEKLKQNIQLATFKDFQNEMVAKQTAEINDKIKFCREIIEYCKNGQPIGLKDLETYSKRSSDELSAIQAKRALKNKMARSVREVRAPLDVEIRSLIPGLVRDVFKTFYLDLKTQPTKEQFMAEFLKSIPSKIDQNHIQNLKFIDLLRCNAISFHYLKEHNRTLIYENPNSMYERFHYLKKMQKYRSQEKHLTYVTVYADATSGKFEGLVASIDGVVPSFSTVLNCECDTKRVVLDCVKKVIPYLKEDTVVVIQYLLNPPDQEIAITFHTNKKIMVEWLKERDVPFNDRSHSAHLYQLIKIHQKKYRFKAECVLEKAFASLGIEVITTPYGYPKLNFCSDLKDDGTIEAAQWIEMEGKLREMEEEMIKTDREMENIVDGMFEMIRNGEFDVDDLPPQDEDEELALWEHFSRILVE